MTTPKKAPRAVKARAGGNASPLLDAMLADLARSGLDAGDAAAMRLQPGDPSELEEMGLPAKMSYVIPYFGIDGKETGYRRWRYLEDTRSAMGQKTDKKAIRYVQQSGTMPEAYLPPQMSWATVAEDPTQPLVITEGEKKAAAMCRNGQACIGLGGVYSFKSNKRKMPLIQIFYDFKWKGRDVVVAYDSDAHTNHMVIAARNELCRELLALGAIPRIAEVPPAEDGAKQGLDDMIVAEGFEAVNYVVQVAHSYAAAQALHELNSEVAYIKKPGCVVVMADGQQMRPTDFTSHAYANRHYHEITVDAKGNEKMVKKKAAQAWLEWEHRFELKRFNYAPGQPKVTDDLEYNTWEGWGCEPKKGFIAPWKRLLDTMFDGHPEMRLWFERWLALPLQRPGAKMFTSVLLWGADEGTGKSLIGKTMGRIYGTNYTLITDKELQDARNEWAINKQFVLGDDVTGHENRKHAERLKVIISQETMRIDPKYISSYTVPDRINYLFTSNRPDAFFIDNNNRRNFIWEVLSAIMTKQQVAEYFEWLDGPGAAALFYHLLNLDLGDMDAADRAPWTNAKDAMVDDTASTLGRWVNDLKLQPDIVLKVADAAMAGDLWSSGDLLKIFDPEEKTRTSASAMSRELKRAGFKQAYGGQPLMTSVGQRRVFAIRNISVWLKEKIGKKLASHYDETRVAAKSRKKF